MFKKVAIISGILFSSILLVGCNEEPEVTVIDASKNEENDGSLSSEESNLLSKLGDKIIVSITEQTELDRNSITIMLGGNPASGIIDVSVGIPLDAKVDDTMIQQIVKDSIKNVVETENVAMSEENITIKIEKYQRRSS
ncbi:MULTISPECIES: topoisomerase [unclassified Lysinibacillus]|uniref:topoisomerase n=1 Tax=unclassified Lysinibacillus TaxID=2636778 RepID=UPI00382B80C4